MDGGVVGGWSAGRTTKMSGGDAHRREGGIEADDRQVSTREMGPIIYGRRVATAHSHVLIEVEGLVKRSGDTDRRGWLGELAGWLREEMVW